MSACGSPISMRSIACISTCCEISWPRSVLQGSGAPGIRDRAHRAKEGGPDEHPRRHGETEEPPIDDAAFPAAGENLADHGGERHELQHHGKRRAAGR